MLTKMRRTNASFVYPLSSVICLAFVVEGRLFDPTTRPDDRSSSSELEGISKVRVRSKCIRPPFIPPFELSDSAAFEVSSSCPFYLHKGITGHEIDGCFPMYSILNWNDFDSSSYALQEFNRRDVQDSLMLEKLSTFATSEEFDLVSSMSSESNLGECIVNMNMRVEGIKGEISGGEGVTSLVAIAVSFEENDIENTILLPIGGCEDVHSRELARRQNPKDTCSIRPNSAETNDCLERCYLSVETDYNDKIGQLADNRDKRISKNNENKEIVLGKLFISRAVQVSTAFARCRCKHNEQDLDQCVLRIFLDALVSENEIQYDVKENFNHHMEEVETWFRDNQKLTCEASVSAALRCHDEC